MLQYYYDNIRTNIVPAEASFQQHFFLTRNGKKYSQVFRRIKESLASDNLIPPQPSLYRILVSSETRRHLDVKKHNNTAKHLSHSMQTSATYYKLMDVSDASEAHASIYSLSLRRRWSQEEIRLITNKWPLSGNNSPTVRDCREFIKEAGLPRHPKEVLFKWEQLKTSS